MRTPHRVYRPCLVVTLFLLLFGLWSPARAMLPTTLSYQAYLTDAGGLPLHETVDITFRLYTQESGGTPIWNETQTMAVNRGVFSVLLGSVVALPPGLFDQPLYLGIQVGADAEMEPRRPLSSVAYAFRAHDTESVGGTPADELARDSEILPIVLASGGSGSGIDADRLDGQEAAAFAMAAHHHDAVYYTKAEVDSLLAAQNACIVALEALLQHFSRNANDITISGANLRIVNGTGTTDGDPNGVGNLIVGYDAERSLPAGYEECSLGVYDNQSECEAGGGLWANNHKSGSHNLVIGDRHNYSRDGGLVAGYGNTINGEWASVSGGVGNTASGDYASVSGGTFSGGHI